MPCKHVSLKTKCIWHYHFLNIVWETGACSLLHLNLAELCIQTYRRWHIVLGLCCLRLYYWRDSFCLWCAFCIWTSLSVKVLLSCLPVAAHAYSHLLQTPPPAWISTCLYSHLLSVSNLKMVSWWKSRWWHKKVISHIRTRKPGRILCRRTCNLHKIVSYIKAPEHYQCSI